MKTVVIDDEPLLLDLISATLRSEGHAVHAVADPLAGLSLCQSQSGVDLLITDVDMRPISGFEVVKRLRLSNVEIPVLFMSGYPNVSGVISKTLGESAVLDKPFTAAQLRTAVNRALRKNETSPRAA